MVRRGRLSKGCLVCRKRKIKCDQAVPSCTQCLKSGWKCPQYADLVERMFQYQEVEESIKSRDQECSKPSNAGTLQPCPSVLCIYRPSISIPCDQTERRYFESFREKIRTNFSGYFETPFWTHLVPQECHNDPAVRHAIFSFAALCKSSKCNIDAPAGTDQHLNFALLQYGKAVRTLRRNISEKRANIRHVLTASVILGWFESFYGNWEWAAQQLRGGLSILQNLKRTKTDKARKRDIGSSNFAMVGSELDEALACLKVHLLSFLAINSVYDKPFDDDSEDQAIENQSMTQQEPSRFADLSEAFPPAMSLVTSSLLLISQSSQSSQCENSDPLQSPARHERDALNTAVERWNKAFEHILAEARQNMANRIELKALEMHVCVVAAEIFIFSTSSREETIFDKVTPKFQYIVSTCRLLLEKEQEFRTATDPKAQFGVGLITILYYCATRCRDPVVRRDSTALLKEWPSKYGLWDSVRAARVAEWVAGIEEEGWDGHRVILEEKRIRMTSLRVQMSSSGGLAVKCRQGSVHNPQKIWKTDIL